MFELKSPQALFEETQRAMTEYNKEPNTRLLLFLLFSLNHLREWIAGTSALSVTNKHNKGDKLTLEEKFCMEIWQLKEFQIVNSLCNQSKHVTISKPHDLSTSRGFTCISSCGDSLDQLYYEIDGLDSRRIFFPVMKKYNDYFSINS